MSLDLQALLYNPLHSLLGSPASLQRADQSVVTGLTVIDKTSGVDVGEGVHAQSLLPAAVIRYSELVTNNIDPDELDTCRITFNGNTWGINSVRMRPSLYGENDGEVYLFLHDKLGALPALLAPNFLGSGLLNVSLSQSISLTAAMRGGGVMQIVILPQALFRVDFKGGGTLSAANPSLQPYWAAAANFLGGGALSATVSNAPVIDFPAVWQGGGKFAVALIVAGQVNIPADFIGGGLMATTLFTQVNYRPAADFVGGGTFAAALSATANYRPTVAFAGGGNMDATLGAFLLKSIAPWENQVLFNTNTATDVTGMNSLGTDASPYACNNPLVAIYKNFIYVGGGNDSVPNFFQNLYRAPIDASGVIGSWSLIGTLPTTLSSTRFIIIKDKLWIVGGQKDNTSTSMVASTWYATINSTDGSLGSWTAGPNLITKRGRFAMWMNFPYLYVAGGLSPDGNTSISSIERAKINSDGTLGAWASAGTIPGVMSDQAVYDTGSRIYLIGGFNGTIQQTGIVATKNSDGSMSAWTSLGSVLPAIAFFAGYFMTENEAFYIGGFRSGFAASGTIYRAPVSGGVIGTWTAGTTMPNARTAPVCALTSTRLYVFGGYSGANMVTHAAFTGGQDDYTNQL